MEYITLSNGVKMPILGFGVFQIPEAATEAAVLEALKVGYRMIDTARIYGNEAAVGRAIKKSGIPRSEIFVTTKIWIDDYSQAKATQAIDTSIKRLGLEYVDLFLIHQPFNDTYGAWRALIEAYKAKKIRAIGVSNFSSFKVKDLSLWSEVAPMVNQIEIHPFYQRAEQIAEQQAAGVVVEAWASFAEGKNDIFNHPTLKAIGDKYHKSVAQVILRWLIQQNVVVIPKSVTPSRIAENFNVFDFALTQEDVKHIKTLDLNKTCFHDHETPITAQFFYDYIHKK